MFSSQIQIKNNFHHKPQFTDDEIKKRRGWEGKVFNILNAWNMSRLIGLRFVRLSICRSVDSITGYCFPYYISVIFFSVPSTVSFFWDIIPRGPVAITYSTQDTRFLRYLDAFQNDSVLWSGWLEIWYWKRDMECSFEILIQEFNETGLQN